MDLKTHYDQLWDDSIRCIEEGKIQTDPYLDANDDSRFGLTLLARPSQTVRQKISEFQQELQVAAPGQYYYPASDLHLTILSLVSCQPGFTISDDEASPYIHLIKSALENTPPINIKLQGVTTSRSAIMICGYPEQNTLNAFRDRLREAFRSTSLYQTIDKRYILRTVHLTVLRFRDQLRDTESFVKKLQSWKDLPFGTTRIDQIELVYNDWYQRESKIRKMKTFDLKNLSF